MPELPEVQTVVNSLKRNLINKSILKIIIIDNRVIYNKYQDLNTLINQKIIKSFRIGKYIIIQLNKHYLAFHLRMTGYLYFSKTKPANNKHMRCFMHLNRKSYLIFEDIRKFGGFYILDNLSEIKNKIGIDPFDKKFTIDWLKSGLKNKKRQMKHLLLDQNFICGLGNIYIDEILWHSNILPLRTSNKIKNKEVEILHFFIIKLLNESIKHHGTTIINFKFDNMKTGNYKNRLKVYGRVNKKCFRCNSLISKIKVAGRSTHICITCQR